MDLTAPAQLANAKQSLQQRRAINRPETVREIASRLEREAQQRVASETHYNFTAKRPFEELKIVAKEAKRMTNQLLQYANATKTPTSADTLPDTFAEFQRGTRKMAELLKWNKPDTITSHKDFEYCPTDPPIPILMLVCEAIHESTDKKHPTVTCDQITDWFRANFKYFLKLEPRQKMWYDVGIVLEQQETLDDPDIHVRKYKVAKRYRLTQKKIASREADWREWAKKRNGQTGFKRKLGEGDDADTTEDKEANTNDNTDPRKKKEKKLHTFFDFPGEIRNTIYRYVLLKQLKDNQWIHIVGKRRFAVGNRKAWDKKLHPNVNALMFVNKQIYLETSTIWWKEQRFSFESDDSRRYLVSFLASPTKGVKIPDWLTRKQSVQEIAITFERLPGYAMKAVAKGLLTLTGLRRLELWADQASMFKRFDKRRVKDLPGLSILERIHNLESVKRHGPSKRIQIYLSGLTEPPPPKEDQAAKKSPGWLGPEDAEEKARRERSIRDFERQREAILNRTTPLIAPGVVPWRIEELRTVQRGHELEADRLQRAYNDEPFGEDADGNEGEATVDDPPPRKRLFEPTPRAWLIGSKAASRKRSREVEEDVADKDDAAVNEDTGDASFDGPPLRKKRSTTQNGRPWWITGLNKELPPKSTVKANTGGGNRTRGSHSALTDYLAANNISAASIRDDYERSRANTQQQADAARNESADELAKDTVEDTKPVKKPVKKPAKQSAKRRRQDDDDDDYVDAGVEGSSIMAPALKRSKRTITAPKRYSPSRN